MVGVEVEYAANETLPISTIDPLSPNEILCRVPSRETT